MNDDDEMSEDRDDTTIGVPRIFRERFEALSDKTRRSYKSFAEFCRAIIREKLDEIEKEERELGLPRGKRT
jgi:hypothetical protein